jgi:TIR domain
MSKSIVFISHITEEKPIAIAFKDLIETSFLGMIDVFVSSDENSISTGQRWLDNITTALKECSIEIILCSPKSVSRPWINFECLIVPLSNLMYVVSNPKFKF